MGVDRSRRIVVVLAIGFATAALASEAPIAVSPGESSRLSLISEACPTFSWGEVEGALSYELRVYQLTAEAAGAQPVLQRSFEGSVDGWTPSLDRCLARGSEYAWSVRAQLPGAPSEWSQPSLFQVAAGPSEAEFERALEVVQDYLAQRDEKASQGTPTERPSAFKPTIVLSAPAATSTSSSSSGPTAEGIFIEGESVLSGLEQLVVTFENISFPAGTDITFVSVGCPAGKTPISGSLLHTAGDAIRVVAYGPAGSSWATSTEVVATFTADFTVHTFCVDG